MVAIACSSEILPSSPDGGTSIDAATFTVDIAPPAPPALPVIDEAALVPRAPEAPQLPVFTPCPSGWRELTRDGVTACEPWPEGGRRTCPNGQAHFPGGSGCVALGRDCDPADEWAIGLPASGVRYVRAGVAAGGNGARTAPFATIAEALAATARGTIALSKGTYEEAIRIPSGVAVIGACVAETLLSSATPAGEALAVLDGDGADLGNLTIAATARPAIELTAFTGFATRVHDVAIAAAGGSAIRAVAATGTIENIVIAAAGAIGLYLAGGSEITLERAQILRPGSFGIQVTTGASLSASEVSIVGPRPGPVPVARTLQIDRGASASFVRAVFEDAGDDLLAAGELTTLSLTDAVVRDGPVRGNGERALGIVAFSGAAVTLSRVRVENVGSIGVLAAQNNATVEATDLIVRDVTSPAAPGNGGAGIFIADTARAMISRAQVIQVPDIGFGIRGASAVASDLIVTDTIDDPTIAATIGIEVQTDAALELHRALLARHQDCGISIRGLDVTISDLEVRESGGAAPPLRVVPPFGGLYTDRGHLILERARFEDNHSFAMFIDEGATRADITDLRVSGTTAMPGVLAGGLFLYDGAEAHVSRAAFDRNAGFQILVRDATLLVEDTAVRDGQPHRDQGQLGEAIVVLGTSNAYVSRVLIERAHHAGLELNTPFQGQKAALAASDVIIRDTSELDEREIAFGLVCRGVCEMTVDRVLLERNRYESIKIEGAVEAPGMTRATIRDLTVRETRPARFQIRNLPEAGEVLGAAVGVFAIGVVLELERASISDSMTGALLLAGGSTLAASDLSISKTRVNEVGYYGRALSIESGSRAAVTRAVIEDAYEVGVLLIKDGRGTFEDLVIRGVSKSGCQDPKCALVAAAAGIAAIRGSSASVRRFDVSESDTSGVMIASGSALDLFDGRISKNPIGANIQDGAFDDRRLTNNVRFDDNGVPVDAQVLPVPAEREGL